MGVQLGSNHDGSSLFAGCAAGVTTGVGTAGIGAAVGAAFAGTTTGSAGGIGTTAGWFTLGAALGGGVYRGKSKSSSSSNVIATLSSRLFNSPYLSSM